MKKINTRGAATPKGLDRINLKKATNTKVNKTINFLLGLSLALFTGFLIIELNTQLNKKEIPTYTTKTLDLEADMGEIRIVDNKPKVITKPKVNKIKPIKKFDMAKPPVIDNDKVESFEDQLDQLDTTPDDDAIDSDFSKKEKGPASALKIPATSHVSFVSEVPLFPGCASSMSREERIDCLNNKMGRYVQRKFDTRVTNDVNDRDLVRISVMFTISAQGLPIDILIKAPNKDLEKEARRVISNLPRMKPGKMNGEPVNVTYTLPIVYKIN